VYGIDTRGAQVTACAIVFGLQPPLRPPSLSLAAEPRLLGYRFRHNEGHSTAPVPSGPAARGRRVDPFNEAGPDGRIPRASKYFPARLESQRRSKDSFLLLDARYNGPVGRSINWKAIRTAERRGELENACDNKSRFRGSLARARERESKGS